VCSFCLLLAKKICCHKHRYKLFVEQYMFLHLRWWIVMVFCSCSRCASFLNDKATLRTSLRGKKQWQCNKKRCKCLHFKKHKKRYYVARDECCEIVDNSSDEETTYQEGRVASVAPATPTPTRKQFCREKAQAVKHGGVASPAVPAIKRIIYAGLSDPKARAPPRTVARPSPVRDGKTTSLMQEQHGLQLNLAGARQSTSKRVRNLKELITEKDSCINEKDECIDV
jgi:hypothetical protein